MLKVGILVHSLPPWAHGGNPREAIQLAEALKENGISTTIFYFSRQNANIKGVHLVRINPIRSPPHTADFLSVGKIMLSCIRVAKVNKLDVLIAYAVGSSEGLASPIISKLLGIKLIIRATGNDILSDLRRYPFLIKPPLLLADSIVPINNHMKDLIVHAIPEVNKKITIIPVAVDVKQFSPKINGSSVRKRFVGDDDFLVLTVTRLVKIKGVDYLLKAFSLLKNEQNKFKLLIVGDGPERKNLLELASSLRLEDAVFFERFVSDEELPYYYAACDLFVLPSITDKNGRTEAFGKVIAEALASGKPVIGANVGGIPSIIRNGSTGLLVDQRNPQMLAAAILKMKSQRNLSLQMTENGRKEVLNIYACEKVLKLWLDLIRAL
jgi:glycosyltransferase involved in cell wall biosynthesis